MKNQLVALILLATFSFCLTSCSKEEIKESSYMELTTPALGTTFQKNDTIKIVASIESPDSPINWYEVSLKNKKGGRFIESTLVTPEASANNFIDVSTLFINKAKKSKDMVVEICASIDDGTYTCENVDIKVEK